MMLSGYLTTLLFLICLTAGIFLFGYTARKSDAVTVTFLEVLSGIFCITLLLIFQQHLSLKELFVAPNLNNWIYLGLAAVTGFVGGNYFSLVNLKWGGESLNSLLSPAITAAVVLFSVLAYQTPLSFIQTVGILLTLGAVVFFLLFNSVTSISVINRSKALWTGLATITCISVNIVFSIKGATVGNISIFHAIWLRLLLALPFILVLILFKKNKNFPLQTKFYLTLFCAVTLQTIAGSYLWFVASDKIGLPLFQTLVATLPFFVYAVDVLLFKKTTPSTLFLLTALVALIGVWLTVK